ncbi:unnamed protein product [Ilex paraguariensis]|uniref:Uncharacterized protein n=1 Tax=Ilex paraguariensis TaxID=185542 RepID=A0ABC8TG98_9AQUA
MMKKMAACMRFGSLDWNLKVHKYELYAHWFLPKHGLLSPHADGMWQYHLCTFTLLRVVLAQEAGKVWLKKFTYGGDMRTMMQFIRWLNPGKFGKNFLPLKLSLFEAVSWQKIIKMCQLFLL